MGKSRATPLHRRQVWSSHPITTAIVKLLPHHLPLPFASFSSLLLRLRLGRRNQQLPLGWDPIIATANRQLLLSWARPNRSQSRDLRLPFIKNLSLFYLNFYI